MCFCRVRLCGFTSRLLSSPVIVHPVLMHAQGGFDGQVNRALLSRAWKGPQRPTTKLFATHSRTTHVEQSRCHPAPTPPSPCSWFGCRHPVLMHADGVFDGQVNRALLSRAWKGPHGPITKLFATHSRTTHVEQSRCHPVPTPPSPLSWFGCRTIGCFCAYQLRSRTSYIATTWHTHHTPPPHSTYTTTHHLTTHHHTTHNHTPHRRHHHSPHTHTHTHTHTHHTHHTHHTPHTTHHTTLRSPHTTTQAMADPLLVNLTAQRKKLWKMPTTLVSTSRPDVHGRERCPNPRVLL
jgi:hypothetical protein